MVLLVLRHGEVQQRFDLDEQDRAALRKALDAAKGEHLTQY